MIAHLFNAPVGESETAVGVGTIGSSEAIMLAGLAFKRKWQQKMKALGKPFHNPNIVTGANVQVRPTTLPLFFFFFLQMPNISLSDSMARGVPTDSFIWVISRNRKM